MTFIKRTRIISTRVSQDEFEAFQRISREHGAHSVSEFVRQIITNPNLLLAAEQDSSETTTAKIAALQKQVEWLLRVVERGNTGSGADRRTEARHHRTVANDTSSGTW